MPPSTLTWFPQTARAQIGWLLLLLAFTLVSSLMLACAAPFAALSALAVLMLPRRRALLFMGVCWAVNQVVGFVWLDYPYDAPTLWWGVIMGGAMVFSTWVGSRVVTSYQPRMNSGALLTIALLATFCAFQLVLLLVNYSPIGNPAEFTLTAKLEIVFIEVAAYAALATMTFLAARWGLFRNATTWAS